MVNKFEFYQGKIVIPIIILLLLFTGNVWAQLAGKISGKVVDEETGEALPGANITIEGTTLGAATDTNGEYFILNVPPGLYSVRASMIGFRNVIQTEVRVKLGQTTTLDYGLKEEAIVGETVTVVSERAAVELDLTASKQTMTSADITETWVNSVDEAVSIQSGVNVNGGIRGGFGLDMYFNIDGVAVRDDGSNKSYAPMNTTSIQELEVLTGGFNAEHGSANSGVVNIVTKLSREKIHGSMKVEFRPSDVYHWGGNMYSRDRWEYQERDQNGNFAPGSVEFWDPSVPGGHDGGQEPYLSMTPEQRLAEWQRIINANPVLNNYADRSQWEFEGTFTGPLTNKLGFMVSGRYKRGVLKFPSALDYEPEWNILGKLDYDIAPNTKLLVSGMHFGTDNSGRYILPYMSEEDAGFGGAGNPAAYFTSAFNAGKYWAFGSYGFGGGTGLGRVKPPEFIRAYTASAKVTHVFSASSFLEVQYYYRDMDREANFLRVEVPVQHPNPDQSVPHVRFSDGSQSLLGLGDQAMGNGTFGQFYQPADNLQSDVTTRKHEIRADFTSQLHRDHQVKLGAAFSTQYFRNVWLSGNESQANTNRLQTPEGADILDNIHKPWEASLYAQDKIEISGMVVNAGLRVDMFNGNKNTNFTFWDPYAMSDKTLGNEGIGVISFDPDGRFAKRTPIQVAVSPRIGISHPITDNTVLHFMYGHFNQRPSWTKIIQNNPVDFRDPRVRPFDDPEGPWDSSTRPDNRFDNSAIPVRYIQGTVIKSGNTELDFERIIQYEVGFDQNIADLLSLDVTLFYKDGKNLTTIGTATGGRNDANGLGSTSNPEIDVFPDPSRPLGSVGGRDINNFEINTNGATLEVRGLEFGLETQFMRNLNVNFTYNASYATSDRYGPDDLYREFEDGTKNGIDTFYGGSNDDKGSSGNNNRRWNPNHTFKLNAVVRSPGNFGPAWGSFYPLGDWTINWYTQWSSGQLFTYHAPGDLSTEPDNMRWKAKTFTNLRVARMLNIAGLRTELYVRAINLFDQKQFRLFTGDVMANFQENGILPFHPTTGEDLVWEWYDLTLLPREVFLGVSFDF